MDQFHTGRVDQFQSGAITLGGCLTTVSEDPGDLATGGGTSAGGGGSTSGGGGSTTGANLCLGVYCAPSFVCDSTDGICECRGQSCSGNCDSASGACLPACEPIDGGAYPVIGQGPDAVQMATATLDEAYNYTLQAACGVPPLSWSLLSVSANVGSPSGEARLDSIGLSFYGAQGQIEGVPTVATNGVPFEIEVQAVDGAGNTGVQNYLLEVVGTQ